MAWVRIDDGFASHPKVVAAGYAAIAVQMRALCYTAHYQLDGQLPASNLPSLLFDIPVPEGAKSWLEYMVAAKLWDTKDGIIYVHDFLDYNPSKAERDEWRHFLSERGKRGGVARSASASRASGGVFSPASTPASTPASRPASSPASPPAGNQQATRQSPSPSPLESRNRNSAPKRRAHAPQATNGYHPTPALQEGDRDVHPVRYILTRFDLAYLARFGERHPPFGDKEAALAKRIHKHYGIDRAVAMVDAFFKLDDPWILNAGSTFAIFETQLGKVITSTGRARDQYDKHPGPY